MLKTLIRSIHRYFHDPSNVKQKNMFNSYALKKDSLWSDSKITDIEEDTAEVKSLL